MGRVETGRVIKELEQLKKKVGKKYKIDKLYLFGSRARGDELYSSDVDIIVVSRDYRNVPFRKRGDIFLDNWRLPVDLEVLCYSPDELERKKKELGIVSTALSYAIEI